MRVLWTSVGDAIKILTKSLWMTKTGLDPQGMLAGICTEYERSFDALGQMNPPMLIDSTQDISKSLLLEV